MPPKHRGEITSVSVIDGLVKCVVEDLDTPGKEYTAIYGSDSISTIEIPPIKAEVVVENIDGEYIITHILSTPASTGISNSKAENGAVDQAASMTFVFDSRDSDASPEKIAIKYNQDGYDIDIDVDGDVNIDAGGNVYISEGGETKKVLTEDAKFEYEDTGDTSDGTASTTTKKTSKVVNGETTEVELE